MSRTVVSELVFDDDVFIVKVSKNRVVDVRDENGRVASISEVIDGYSRWTDTGLVHQVAGYVETTYDAHGVKKTGVIVEVVSVWHDNGVAAYVPHEVLSELFIDGCDWESRLRKIRRSMARKDSGYGQGLSVEERVEKLGYKVMSLPVAGKDEMGVSAWNHSGNPRVTARALERKRDKRNAVVDLSILGL